MNGNVKIGPEFFRKIGADYSNWKYAWAREISQNSLDSAGCTVVRVTIDTVNGHTVATVSNNGEPMSREILCDKLLTLGGSHKDAGATGGFGVAKSLLYYMHDAYTIHTGNLTVTGSGASYDLHESEYVNGTTSSVTFSSDVTDDLISSFTEFFTYCSWRGTAIVNNETISERLKAGSKRTTISCGTIYTNRRYTDLLIVRVNGQPMYTRGIDYSKGCVVVELNSPATDILQSSRDALLWEHREELDKFIINLSTNRKQAFKVSETVRLKYKGYRIVGDKPKSAALVLPDSLTTPQSNPVVPNNTTQDNQVPTGGTIDDEHVYVTAAGINCVLRTPRTISEIPKNPEFTIRSELADVKIPSWFIPETFSTYSRTLAWRWLRVLKTIADLHGAEKPFSIGFLFSDDNTEAEYESVNNERIIYVKPAIAVRRPGKPIALQCRWTFDKNGMWDLVSFAAHEFVHYLGYRNHDEDFAAMQTAIMSMCLRERTLFSKLFQEPVMWPQ